MNFEKHDVSELYKSIGIGAGNYIEVKEHEAIVKIRRKWPLVDQIVSFSAQPPVNQLDKTT